MHPVGYIGSTFVAIGFTAWSMVAAAKRHDLMFSAPANDVSGSDGGVVAARRPAGDLAALLEHGVPAIPLRMRSLPRDENGKPIPFLVGKISGSPDAAADASARIAAVHANRNCWLCGEKLGQYGAFLTEPIAAVTRISHTPPAHLDCAKYAGLVGLVKSAGMKVTLVWSCRKHRVAETSNGRRLFVLGDAEQAFWYADLRTASYEEVQAAMEEPLGRNYAIAHESGQAAVLGLDMQVARATKLYPPRACAG